VKTPTSPNPLQSLSTKTLVWNIDFAFLHTCIGDKFSARYFLTHGTSSSIKFRSLYSSNDDHEQEPHLWQRGHLFGAWISLVQGVQFSPTKTMVEVGAASS
jgi:hypothetical protein